jgi:Potential Queuosine, Q, salvage protein family
MPSGGGTGLEIAMGSRYEGGVTVLEDVRRRCAEVAGTATSVRVVDDRVGDYAASLPAEAGEAPVDPLFHDAGSPEATLAFVVTFGSIAFGSGWFPHLHKLPGRSGTLTVATRLRAWFDAAGPPPAGVLAAMDRATVARLLDQPEGGPAGELMGHYATALSDLGGFLLDRHGGRFAGPVEAAGRSAAALVEELATMPLYRDVWRGVPFYKRAQLTAADVAVATGHRFDDLDRLTLFADNLVPHVLRMDGVLAYDPGLVARIEAGDLLVAGSQEEVEIRACAVTAVEGIVAALHDRGRPATAAAVDHLLWRRGQGGRYKAVPRHRCRTVSY